jgi:hypothetical protein
MEEKTLSQGPEDWKETIRDEIKQLRADIMVTKKSVSKGDKKAKKEIQTKIDEMEALIAEKQALLSSGVDPSGTTAKEETPKEDDEEQPSVSLYQEKEKGKKQSKKEKKAATSAARVQALRSVPKGPDLSAIEQRKLEEMLKGKNLEIHDVTYLYDHCSNLTCRLSLMAIVCLQLWPIN